MDFAENKSAQAGQQTQTATGSTVCPYARECRCITEGVQAAHQKSFMLQGEVRRLAAEGLPACHSELREHVAPGKNGKEILARYARAPEGKRPRASILQTVTA